MKHAKISLDSLFEDLEVESLLSESERRQRSGCLTIWIDEEAKEKYAHIQGQTNKGFSKKLNKLVQALIERVYEAAI